VHNLRPGGRSFSRLRRLHSATVPKQGHELVQEPLDKLDDPELVRAIGESIADEKLAANLTEELAQLERELADLRQKENYGPDLLQREIKRAFPKGTAGKTVDIVPRSDSPSDGAEGFLLYADRHPLAVDIPEQVGKALMAQKMALQKVTSDIAAKEKRRQELELQISDLRRALPRMKERTQHMFNALDPEELRQRLNGNFLGIVFDDRGQPVVLIRREISEVLSEVPANLKQQLVTNHLGGRITLPEKIQQDLGIADAIKAAMAAITKAISAPAAPPEIAAPTAPAEPPAATS